MKVLQINAVYGKYSTGRTMKEMHEYFLSNGIDSYIAAPDLNGCKENAFQIGNKTDWKVHALLSRILGTQGYFSSIATNRLLKHIDKIQPDVIVLRNLHGNYINVLKLLKYIGKHNIAVIIVLHDSWFYTGKCVYYIEDNCNRWKNECGNCPALKKGNPSLIFDRSRKMLREKAELFSQINKLAVVGVSKWVSNDASVSILKNALYHTYIYNWIDLDKFKKRDSVFIKTKYGLQEKKIILGIAMVWNEAKGICLFENLADILPDDYRIILVGDDSQIKTRKNNIQYAGTINDVETLIDYYSMADVFVNPTIQETFGKTTAEAMACSLPVVAYNGTATPELVGDNGECGFLISTLNAYDYLDPIIRVIKAKEYYGTKCRRRAELLFDKENNINKYVDIIRMLVN